MNILSALDVSADYLIFGTGSQRDDKGGKVLSDCISFLSRRESKDIAAYYEIIKFMTKYIEDGKFT